MKNLTDKEKQLIDRSIDEDLNDTEATTVNELLKAKTEARQYYYEACALAAMLNHEAQTADTSHCGTSVLPEPRAKASIVYFQVAAIAAAVLLAFWLGTQRSSPPVVASPSDPGRDAAPSTGTISGLEGEKFERMQYLESGVLRMDLPGVKAAIAGPALFRRLSDRKLEITEGSLLARVDASGVGFTVKTPAAEIVDLGTVFGVRVDHDSQTDTHVFEGLVSTTSSSAKTIELSSGQSLLIWPNGTGPMQPGSADLRAFRKLVPHASDILAGITGSQAPLLSIPDPVLGSQIGRWTPGSLSRTPTSLEWDVSQYLLSANQQVIEVNLPHQAESSASLHRLSLIQNNQEIASYTPPSNNSIRQGITNRLFVNHALAPDTPIILRAQLSSRNPRSDSGMIWLKAQPAPRTLLPQTNGWHGNLATQGKASAQSHEHNKRAEYCIDGKLGDGLGWWASPLPQDVTIDLGHVHRIDRIHAFLFANSLRYYQYRIDTSADDQTWTNVVNMSNSRLLASRDGEQHQFPATQARYVRFQFLSNSNNDAGHLAELMIFPAGE